MSKLSMIDIVALILVIIGGINWGLVAIGGYAWDLVAFLPSWLSVVVYALVGLSALWSIMILVKGSKSQTM